MSAEKMVLGWREWIGFPDLGIPQIKAKVDTGARTSCLHAYYVEPFERDGQAWVRFGIHPWQGDTTEEVQCEARVKDQRTVRDSGGHEEVRYVIETSVTLGEKRHGVEVTLTSWTLAGPICRESENVVASSLRKLSMFKVSCSRSLCRI